MFSPKGSCGTLNRLQTCCLIVGRQRDCLKTAYAPVFASWPRSPIGIGRLTCYALAGNPFPCLSVPSVDNPLQQWLGRRSHLRTRPIPWNRRTRRSRRSRKLAMIFAVSNRCSSEGDSRRLKHCRLPLFARFATFCSNVFSGSIAIPNWTKGSDTVLSVVNSKTILRYPEQAPNVLFDLWPATRLP
jgi:hypothetical protein